VTPLIAHDNEQQLRTLSPQYLLAPEILAALGILPEAAVGRFQVETAGGEILTLAVAPVRADSALLSIAPPTRSPLSPLALRSARMHPDDYEFASQ
jgi:hypothetical protein